MSRLADYFVVVGYNHEKDSKYIGEDGHGLDTLSFITHSSEPSLCSETPNRYANMLGDTECQKSGFII